MAEVRVKRKAESDDNDGEHMGQRKRVKLVVPGLELSGHGCAICKKYLLLSCCAKMFTACGHIFHVVCLDTCEKCPVCTKPVNKTNQLRTVMMRTAKNLLGKNIRERIEILDFIMETRGVIAQLSLRDFFKSVSKEVFKGNLPRLGTIVWSPGRMFKRSFVLSPNKKEVDVFMKCLESPLLESPTNSVTNCENQRRLFETMWDIYMHLSGKDDNVDEIFERFVVFEDMFVI